MKNSINFYLDHPIVFLDKDNKQILSSYAHVIKAVSKNKTIPMFGYQGYDELTIVFYDFDEIDSATKVVLDDRQYEVAEEAKDYSGFLKEMLVRRSKRAISQID